MIGLLLDASDPTKIFVDIAQVVTAIVAVVGIFISIRQSNKANREIQKDRIYNQRPVVLFDDYLRKIPILVIDDDGLKAFPAFTVDGAIAEALGIASDEVNPIGKLTNYGNGPATEIEIQWVLETVTKAGTSIKTHFADLAPDLMEKYTNADMDSYIKQRHMASGKSADVLRLPYFANLNGNLSIKSFEGEIKITYSDAFRNECVTRQKFKAIMRKPQDTATKRDIYLEIQFKEIIEIGYILSI